MSRIVVGVDGSAPALAALRWADDEARRRQATLAVVVAWQPQVLLNPYPYGPVPMPDDREIEAAARTVAERAVEEAGVVGDPEHDVVIEVVEGPPVPSLLAAAAGADLLVVGSRGHGAFTGMLLGSVSQHCAGHAPCPVVVVPDPAHHEHRGGSSS